MTDDRHQIPAASWEGDVCQTCSELNIYETSDLKDGESEIRLLSIAKADDFDQPLVVQLVVNSLNDPASLKYVALSYVWGNPSLAHSVECNGCQLRITRNLDLALRTSRHLGHRLLWADQICINQKNTRERASQVALMSKIYSSAAKVLIYLGEETEWSRSALKCIDRVSNQIEVDNKLNREGLGENWLNHPEYHFDRESWARWSRLYDYPWFTRVWVIQESLLAEDLDFAIGSRAFPGWLLFGGMFYVLDHLDEDQNTNYTGQTAYWETIQPEKIDLIRTWKYFKRGYYTQRYGRTLAMQYLAPEWHYLDHFQAMTDLKTFECTDPRDRVYAILAFFDAGIKINYQSTVEEVFTDFARYVATSLGSPFDCLYEAGRHKQTLSALPSWVPDWSAKPVWSFIAKLSPNTPQLGNIAGDILPAAFVWKDGHSLWAKGSMIDTVKEMTQPMHGRRPKGNWEPEKLGSLEWKNILDWHHQARAFIARTTSSRYPDATDRLKVLIRLTCFDLFRMDPRNADATDLIGNGVNAYCAALEQVQSATSSNPWVVTQVTGDQRVPVVIKCLAMLPRGHRLCATSKGFFGFVPMEACEGDRVCIVPGLGHPLILRPESGGRHSFIGGAFIIDVMNGEALKFPDFKLEGLLLQ